MRSILIGLQMPDKQQETEQRIFEAAVELPPGERAAYLTGACGGNLQLERRMHRLIAAHEHAQHAASHLVAPVNTPDDPERIGPYRILERIGEGGMGVVYLAEQTEPVRRRVAVKIIKMGMDTREVIARFESERQALALMNHQCIARILDVGATEQGRPYFVMEYVRGISITEYCNKMRLDIDTRLGLFRQVCLAIQHAHQKGIIHRDIKPSNVLVTDDQERPLPKVIDFGVAKATDYRLSNLTLHTRIGNFVGTPEYMSPEQAEMSPLNVDTRSDVYSLGAVLYELLVGVRPLEFDTSYASYMEIQHAIRSSEPLHLGDRLTVLELGDVETAAHCRSLSSESLRRKLRGELSWIAATALAKDPRRRYQTALSLARDVERYLKHEPVEASPEGVFYRGRKFVRRHRAAFAAASLMVLALTVGLTVASLGFFEARQERLAAEEARNESEAVTQFLSSMLSAADPKELGKDVTVRQALDQASITIDERFADQPQIRARLHDTIGATYYSLGVLELAQAHFEQGLAVYVTELPDNHLGRLTAQHRLAMATKAQGRYGEAEALYLETIAERSRILGAGHAETLKSMNNLGLLYADQDRHDEAQELLENILSVRIDQLGKEHPHTLASMNNLAIHYIQRSRYDDAEPLLLDTYEIRRRISGSEHPNTIMAMHNLGIVYDYQGRTEEAYRIYESVAERSPGVFGDEHPLTLRYQSSLGIALSDQGRLAEAGELLEATLQKMRRALDDDHPQTLHTSAALGRSLLERARYDEAAPYLKAAAERAVAFLPEDSTRLASYRARYGRTLLRQARLYDAESNLLQALQILSNSDDRVAREETPEVLSDLVELYESKAMAAEAARYRSLLPE